MENATNADATRRTVELVSAVAQNAVTNAEDVVEGSIIKAVYIELWFKGNAVAGTEDKFQFAIEKVPAGAAQLNFTDMNSMMGYANKKNVFYFSQGVTGDLTTGSIPIFRQWMLLPKGKQRFGLGDRLVLAVSTTGATCNTCGFTTYKEYK